MSDARLARRLRSRVVYLALSALCLFMAILPLSPATAGLPSPDVMLAITLAWAVRRPEDLPLMLILPVFLFSDLMLSQPPGLWTAIVLVAVEILRNRHRRARLLPFAAEWIAVALMVIVMTAAYWGIQAAVFVDQTSLASQMRRAGMTILCYPAFVALLHYGLGIRKLPAPEGFGRRAAA